jgi:hypothetical protein
VADIEEMFVAQAAAIEFNSRVSVKEEASMSKSSRGKFHHVDSTVTCPDCGRRFRTGTVVAEGPANDLREPLDNTGPSGRTVAAHLRSKQPERKDQWGLICVPAEAVTWQDKWVNAFKGGEDASGPPR